MTVATGQLIEPYEIIAQAWRWRKGRFYLAKDTPFGRDAAKMHR